MHLIFAHAVCLFARYIFLFNYVESHLPLCALKLENHDHERMFTLGIIPDDVQCSEFGGVFERDRIYPRLN